MALGTLPDLLAVFVSPCRENPSTDKLSRAINYRNPPSPQDGKSHEKFPFFWDPSLTSYLSISEVVHKAKIRCPAWPCLGVRKVIIRLCSQGTPWGLISKNTLRRPTTFTNWEFLLPNFITERYKLKYDAYELRIIFSERVIFSLPGNGITCIFPWISYT